MSPRKPISTHLSGVDRERDRWQKNAIVMHGGQMIHAIEEDGRRFWAVRLPGEWCLRQEFSLVEQAKYYIDEESRRT